MVSFSSKSYILVHFLTLKKTKGKTKQELKQLCINQTVQQLKINLPDNVMDGFHLKSSISLFYYWSQPKAEIEMRPAKHSFKLMLPNYSDLWVSFMYFSQFLQPKSPKWSWTLSSSSYFISLECQSSTPPSCAWRSFLNSADEYLRSALRLIVRSSFFSLHVSAFVHHLSSPEFTVYSHHTA